jgi:hypothetical protein
MIFAPVSIVSIIAFDNSVEVLAGIENPVRHARYDHPCISEMLAYIESYLTAR